MVKIPDFCTLLSDSSTIPCHRPSPNLWNTSKTLKIDNISDSMGPTCLTSLQCDTVDSSFHVRPLPHFHSTYAYFLLILNMSIDIIFFSLRYDSGTPELLSLDFLLWIFQNNSGPVHICLILLPVVHIWKRTDHV